MAKNTLNTRNLCAAALLMATSILLPQLFHLVGGPAAGGLFLPMHIPVLIAGLLLGPFYGTVVAVFAPVISFLMTGMPPAAILPFMLAELVAYGLITGFLSAKGCNLYLSLIAAQVGGRLVNAAVLLGAASLFHLNVPPVVSVWTSVISGIPGIVIQLLLIPAIVILLRKVIHFDRTHQAG